MASVDDFLAFVVSHVCDGEEFNDATQKALKPRAQIFSGVPKVE